MFSRWECGVADVNPTHLEFNLFLPTEMVEKPTLYYNTSGNTSWWCTQGETYSTSNPPGLTVGNMSKRYIQLTTSDTSYISRFKNYQTATWSVNSYDTKPYVSAEL